MNRVQSGKALQVDIGKICAQLGLDSNIMKDLKVRHYTVPAERNEPESGERVLRSREGTKKIFLSGKRSRN
ncbi:hypothetical protein [Paenibacillus lutrae]|uniref:Uncharacterized protein n=1 Tax=Paenibacillus lutrae TaxID=2078573 RepID=A0A7X3FG74_9BACL|nr:hypothetical protein [Paenibacillus lutrae]MVO99050.1 hypothetical protein [Paenibacillus lutrae]